MMQILETLKIEPGDVAIMDRGLPSHELFASLLELGVDIVARMSTSDVISWNEIRPFLIAERRAQTSRFMSKNGFIQWLFRLVWWRETHSQDGLEKEPRRNAWSF